MKFSRWGESGFERPVVIHDGSAYDVTSVADDFDGQFFATDGSGRVTAALEAGSLPLVDPGSTRTGAPIARPGKVVCVGLNYRDHAEETGAALPEEPVLFLKDPSTVIGPFDDIRIPPGSLKTDWEVELGVVIGREARYLDSPADAAGHIAGFVVSHDVSERAYQLERGGQWDKGKSCETFNPLGPLLVTPDEVPGIREAGLRLTVNGELRQNGSTSNMLFGIDHLIWYISQFMVLHPGDLINTGTPAGVALGLPGTPYLRAGDVVELEIDGLGRARQAVVA